MARPEKGNIISKIDTYLNCTEDNSIHEAKPCPLCARKIIQAGINNVYLRFGEGKDDYKVVSAKELIWVQQPEDI